MSQMDVHIFTGSFVAVALILAITVALGFEKSFCLSDNGSVERIARRFAPRSQVLNVALSDDGRAAFAQLEDGRWLVIRTMGDHIAARAVAPEGLMRKWRGSELSARLTDSSFPGVRASFSERPEWLR